MPSIETRLLVRPTCSLALYRLSYPPDKRKRSATMAYLNAVSFPSVFLKYPRKTIEILSKYRRPLDRY